MVKIFLKVFLFRGWMFGNTFWLKVVEAHVFLLIIILCTGKPLVVQLFFFSFKNRLLFSVGFFASCNTVLQVLNAGAFQTLQIHFNDVFQATGMTQMVLKQSVLGNTGGCRWSARSCNNSHGITTSSGLPSGWLQGTSPFQRCEYVKLKKVHLRIDPRGHNLPT